MKFFEKCTTIEELKKEYKKLAFKHHPDKGGDVEIMKVVNNAYEFMFDKLSKMKDTKEDNKKDDSYKAERFNDFIDIINKIINLEGIEIEIIGTWLWIQGNTYPHKSILSELGFLYSKKNKSWYMMDNRDTKKTWTKKTYSMEEKRQMHGSSKLNKKTNPSLT